MSLQPLLLQAEQAQFPQPTFVKEVLQPSDHLCGLPLDPLQQLSIAGGLKLIVVLFIVALFSLGHSRSL